MLLREIGDSSVGTATGYGTDGREFDSLRHSVQVGSQVRPIAYKMGTGGSFPGGKTAAACS
jgi:hypothetical protein